MQSAQSVSAAYYFDSTARDYTLAAGAIELVVEGAPCPAFIEPSQSCELIFCARLDRHAREKACWRWWQIPSRFARTERARDKGRERESPGLVHLPLETWRRRNACSACCGRSIRCGQRFAESNRTAQRPTSLPHNRNGLKTTAISSCKKIGG
jgi:hypothetical protein